jgi:hypothetical protein
MPMIGCMPVQPLYRTCRVALSLNNFFEKSVMYHHSTGLDPQKR